MKRMASCWILGLTLCSAAACTKTERSIVLNRSVNTASSAWTTLEPGTPAGAPGSVLSVNSCFIDLINEQAPPEQPLALRLNGRLRLDGWVIDASNLKSTPEQTFVLLQAVGSGARWHGRVSSRVPRVDVARAMGSALMSGFNARLDLSQVPRGEYLVLVGFWQEGPLQICDNGRRVLIE